MQVDSYRSPVIPPVLAEIAARGRAVRERLGLDPHAVRAPNEISDPRAGLLDHFAAAREDAFEHVLRSPWLIGTRRGRAVMLFGVAPGLALFGGLILLALVVTVVFAIMAAQFGRWIVLLTPLTVVAAGVVAALVVRVRNQPRRWLVASPFRAEGYLELLGRENRVVRVRAVVQFARSGSPELEFFKDVLTGAGVPSQGVTLAAPGAIAVHSPEIQGSRAMLHGWFQTFCDGALNCLSETYPIEIVRIEER